MSTLGPYCFRVTTSGAIQYGVPTCKQAMVTDCITRWRGRNRILTLLTIWLLRELIRYSKQTQIKQAMVTDCITRWWQRNRLPTLLTIWLLRELIRYLKRKNSKQIKEQQNPGSDSQFLGDESYVTGGSERNCCPAFPLMINYLPLNQIESYFSCAKNGMWSGPETGIWGLVTVEAFGTPQDP